MSTQRGAKGPNKAPRGGPSKGNNGSKSSGNYKKTTFKGACADLGENIYTIGDAKQADRYNKTTEQIANYIQREYSRGQDVADAITQMEHQDMTKYQPAPPEDEEKLTKFQEMILQQEIKDYVERKTKYIDNCNKAYGLILGQCTQGVKNKLEARKDWTTLSSNHDPIELLKAIKEITQDYQDSKYPIASIHRALVTLLTIKQEEKEGLSAYTKRFKVAQDIMEAQNGPILMQQYITKMPGYEEERAEEFCQEAYNQLLAYTFIQGADPKRSGDLVKDLSNQFALGTDNYPKTLASAVNTVANYKSNTPKKAVAQGTGNRHNANGHNQENQLGFAQQGGKKPPFRKGACHTCGQKGHYSYECPNKDNTQQGTANAQQQTAEQPDDARANDDNSSASGTQNGAQFFCHDGINLQSTNTNYDYLRTQVLLDNQSTTDIFCDPSYLENVRTVPETLYLKTNGGTLKCNTKGDLKGYGPVWCHDKAITNIISFSNAKRSGKYTITYDENQGFTMRNKQNGNTTIFRPDASGLFTAPLPKPNKTLALVNTVEENKKLYTKRQVERAEAARRLYEVIGYPSVRDYKIVVQTNQIKDCPVTIDDIKISEKIFGPDVYALKGKSTRPRPRVVVNDYIEIPRSLKQAHQGITLCADIMFIDEVPLLLTVSKHIKFLTIRYIDNREGTTIWEALKHTFVKYNQAGFAIKEFRADVEFEKIRFDLEQKQINVNLTSGKEKQPDIERQVRVVKERYRALYHKCPFSMWPKIMIIRGATYCVRWLNTFPPSGGISPTYSPRAIITGRPVSYDKHCRVGFGSYVQATTTKDPTNTPEERCIDGIYLGPLDNTQGGYEVLNLNTGRIITRHKIDEIPMPTHVIKRVEQLAARDGFKPHAEPTFRSYALLAGVDEQDPEEDDDYDPTDDSDDDESYDEEIEQEELQDLANEGVLTPGVGANDNYMEPDNEDDQSIATANDDEDEESTNNGPVPEPPRRTIRARAPPTRLSPQMKGKSHTYGTNHLVTQFTAGETIEYETEEATVLALAFAQTYSLFKGIQKFGDKGKEAAHAEMKQLHDRKCFEPVNINDYSEKERRQAMESLLFLTEKRCGKIKGRAVADGSKQRTWMSKDEAASPTVHQESIMLTAAIEAREHRDVAIVDIPNAFIQTPNAKVKKHHEVDLMKIKGKLAYILLDIDPNKYGPYMTEENGVPVIYVLILRALYGMIKSPLLFYRKLREDLEGEGFVVNPYDPCVANKTVNGKQLTVMWHVDDLKVSHVDPKVVDKFINWAKKKYEDTEITKLKPSRGKVHDYLGMILDYSVPGKVKISMKDYIDSMLKEFPHMDEVNQLKEVKTPAAEHLFTVNNKAPKLSPERKETFHTTVAKGLFLCKRARPDLQPTVPFLCTRVKDPDEDDWKKLLRMLKFLQATRNDELTLEAEKGELVVCKWYPDAAFAVHSDYKSHTGAVLTLGKGAVNTISAKQKLNTRSSTEAELVGADDIAPQAIWTKNFLEAQGYSSETTVYQDNTSAILLEKNGMESSSKRTRHINIRYFFIKDCVDKRLFDIQYCPTDDMVGDFPSKPLQGSKFKKHRRAMMNLE